MKVVCKLKLDDENSDGRVIQKILKHDESNQYGYAMTKPLLTGCIKKQDKVPNWKKFNFILETVDLHDTIGHLFVLDIVFNYAQPNAKTLIYNKTYCPIFEKQNYRSK